jgi:hypothetical protein
MQTVRPAIATDPRTFGRSIERQLSADVPANGLSSDFKLFATTFLAGFVFVSVLLA